MNDPHRTMIARYVGMLDQCTDFDELAFVYAEMIGDEPAPQSADELRAECIAYCRELCGIYGVPPSDVGIPDESGAAS